jgi:hypothetical protein
MTEFRTKFGNANLSPMEQDEVSPQAEQPDHQEEEAT